jgi:radical SAM superfamily enzyme YgiQ (UPF0313 family)
MAGCETFVIVMIKPTHYDDDGYPIQWWRSFIPSNSLACVYGIAREAVDRKVLGDHVECTLLAIDETNTPIRPKRIIDQIKADGGKGLVCLVGVQSNQFPRAVDLAKPFIDADIPVVLGGFHVAGCLSMLVETPREIVESQEMGISIFAGEAEQGRFDGVLKDAYAGTLKPLYDFLDDMPGLGGQPIPVLPKEQVKRTFRKYASFDLGRGCPFQCSFCTIINVQGRISRFRTADDLEAIIRANAETGIYNFFLTDDNLARNRNWEAFFDRLIELREKENLKVRLQVQVDTMCHRIEGFIDKAVAAGVDQVFVGMESINPENLLATKKKQNKVREYRQMFLDWKRHPVVIIAGYILGFPNDTKESILHDVEIIKRELPIDLIYFTNLTPLPGCEDHKTLLEKGAWMDNDLNKYELNHRVTHHEKMSDEEWDEAYRQVWDRYYTPEHMERILRRMVALGSNKKLTTVNRLIMYREFRRLYGVHPLEGGFVRRKYRKDRRPYLPRENPLVFYPNHAAQFLRATFGMAQTYTWLRWKLYKIWHDPKRFE